MSAPFTQSVRPRRTCTTVPSSAAEPSGRALVRVAKKRKTVSSGRILSNKTVDDSDSGDNVLAKLDVPSDSEDPPPAAQHGRLAASLGLPQDLFADMQNSGLTWSQDEVLALRQLMQALGQASQAQRSTLLQDVRTAVNKAVASASQSDSS